MIMCIVCCVLSVGDDHQMGKTVLASFKTAKISLKHCADVPHVDQANKFLLLPQGNDEQHNVRIFETVPEGDWINASEADTPNNIESLPGLSFLTLTVADGCERA